MAGSLMGGKMGDLAAVNAQEHIRRDVVSISLHVCYGFSACPSLATLLSIHATSFLSPAIPSQEEQKTEAHYLGHSRGFICSASPQGSGSYVVPSFHS